ncbi:MULTISPECIES: DUF2796 domain-containing protein [unclassified Colwellia]|jgi:hypothetical protein|uniref:DUF2796 domain-containing protein n=1 Tax=unclassified Colwellia TaxID=196834 RepID=UPI0015F456FB|nr:MULTISPECIES: DUF2796 domain-containing protein [unclassified Colwellia]MBA6253303.1 DUF2796 domain-containing protein [Colwellia sp. MB3u-55]MBA6397851.1 DUF2796 domain-containing protein [Colwellia sp. BRX10-4]
MKVQKLVLFLLNIILLNIFLSGQLVYAKNQQEQSTRLDAHVHGSSEITMAIEGEILDIQLVSPTVNLFGFEHKASNKKEIMLVNNAKGILSNAASIFSFSGGSCSLINIEIDVSGLLKDHENEHEHQSKNSKKSHDDHSIKETVNENHSQIVSNYRYHCEKTATLSAITVLAFERFSGIKKIRTMWVTDKKQGALTLNINNNIIYLR